MASVVYGTAGLGIVGQWWDDLLALCRVLLSACIQQHQFRAIKLFYSRGVEAVHVDLLVVHN